MTKIETIKDLKAGYPYCLVTIAWDDERQQDYDRCGACVYWTGEQFMYEDGDVCNEDWDFAIEQASSPNPEYIVKQSQSLLHPEMESIIANWQTLTAARKAY